MKTFLRAMVFVVVHAVTLPIRLPIVVGITLWNMIKAYRYDYPVLRTLALFMRAYWHGLRCDFDYVIHGYESAKEKFEYETRLIEEGLYY